jgi:folate-dependent phosphoribosylglycinamide formyltransferase PurN
MKIRIPAVMFVHRECHGFGRTALICHHDDPLNRYGLARWLASFTDLAGVVVIREPKARFWKRVRREITRVGLPRFLDVFLFQIYYRLFLATADEEWQKAMLQKMEGQYRDVLHSVRFLETTSPNSAQTEQFLRDIQPDIILARCKSILNRRVFTQARLGTFVMHPGICPAYRNAHGCFWALANRDTVNVGMTLLKIDDGVDTGPVYGYYTYAYDEVAESHIVIQHRMVLENLDSLQTKLCEILAGTAATIDTRGSKSQAWGQPWLTRYLRWKRAAKRAHKRNACATP